MSQAVHVFPAQVADGIAYGVIGHVGGIMAAGDIGVPSQIFEDMAVCAGTPFSHYFTGALGAGAQDHRFFIVIGQGRVVGHSLKKIVVGNICTSSALGSVDVPESRHPAVVVF